jgi:DNA invertase Pin-like site-specific DNA recombinase
MPKTWVGVVRISHMGSRKAGAENFHADRDQVALIKSAVPRGDRLTMLPPELNVSGGLPLEQRPSLLAAVEGIEAGQYAGIIVGYLSRLGRNVREQLRTYDRVHAAGGRIIVAQAGIDATTRGGRLQRNILAAIHEDEREAHVERFDHLRRIATQRGVWPCRQTPTGYGYDKATRRLVPDARAAEVRTAFHDRAAGTVTISDVARRLRMTQSGARQLLRNRVYLGELRVGRYVNVAAHEPLIDVETFEAAQRSTPRPARRPSGPALLAGLVRCASCGHRMTRSGTPKSPTYSCPTGHSGERCPRPAAITCSIVDEHVEAIALAELKRLAVTASADRGLEQARAKVARAQRELDAFAAAVEAAGMEPAELVAALRSRRDALQDAQDDLRAEQARRPYLPGPASGADVWDELNPQDRNALLSALLSAVVVQACGRGGRPVPPAERVRVLAYGADVRLPQRRGGEPSGLCPIPLPDFDDPGVLRMPAGKDSLERPSGVR